jgi:Ca2+-transporting ATPase
MRVTANKRTTTNVNNVSASEFGNTSATSMKAWHTFPADGALQSLESRLDGLSPSEAKTRLARHGPNQLPEAKRRTIAAMILDQFKDFMILLLIGAAVVSGVIGEPQDTIAILVIVLLNAVIGFVQEIRAERAMEALRKLAAPNAVVRREGQAVEIPTVNIVPGDIVLLEAGRIVPGDLRLLETASLRIAEAVLTGESVPVEKTVDAVPDHDAALGDRRNMAYKGTQVVYGRGVGVAAETGISTELGRIANLLGTEKEVKTPLQKRLAVFGRNLGLAALAICALVFVVGVMRGEDVVLMFLTAVSLAVAAVPEALPAVVTITLALGARRMVRTHALIRKL